MIRGPSFIVSTMQEETTPIFKRLWYDWTQQQPGIEPTNPLGQCWVPPIVAFYDQQGLLRTYSLPGGSIRSPHPGSPRGSERMKTPWKIQHLLGEYEPNMCMESENLEPGWRVRGWKPHEKLRFKKKQKKTSAWRVWTKYVHGEWETKTWLESESIKTPWKIKIKKNKSNICLESMNQICAWRVRT